MGNLVRRVLLGAAMALTLSGGMGACLPLPPGGVVVIEIGPPPPRWDHMGRPPGDGHVWIGGFWSWRAGDYFWVPGHWSPIPPRHRYWVPGHWVHTRRGWYFSDGYWD